MTTRPRRLRPLILLALTASVAACGWAGPGATPDDPSEVPTVAPSSARSAVPSTAAAMSQTDTTWGRIWDGVPAGFPRFAGGRSADDATPEPVSDVYVVEGGDATAIASWLQSSMEGATYSTESLSGPLEDGGFVLDSVGDGDCRIQTTIAPQGGLILVTVRYGAACPAS
jgi:predicted small lipoprotein YifL